jgi:hypothetical protein
MVSPHNREVAAAWGLGLVGLLKGVVEVYLVEPTVAAIRMRRNGGHIAVAKSVGSLPSNKNIISFPAMRELGATAIHDERVAA